MQPHKYIQTETFQTGDDIVIADSLVANKYTQCIQRLGVKISYGKSLLSDTGCAEFAKRFQIKGLSKDISPISVKSLLNAHHPAGLYYSMISYPGRRLSTYLRVAGALYKVLGSLHNTTSKRWMRVLCLWRKRLPFDLWVGQGMPLDPYIRGNLIMFLRTKLKPRDITLPPDEVDFSEDQQDFLEYTQIRGWMDLWLNYL
ncbi:putative mitochondrial protein [Apostasia shenzhenica]|uniref:Putative mitochondrial protein n=1 Tax=Apostasia shenzhenica TaxID=1088818 RepID=A0A2I0AM91_9ASPA|nr:putative mitochondrial protein [Apostasia shenzhenica]